MMTRPCNDNSTPEILTRMHTSCRNEQKHYATCSVQLFSHQMSLLLASMLFGVNTTILCRMTFSEEGMKVPHVSMWSIDDAIFHQSLFYFISTIDCQENCSQVMEHERCVSRGGKRKPRVSFTRIDQVTQKQFTRLDCIRGH